MIDLPSQLTENALSLKESLNLPLYAWSYEDSKNVLRWALENGYITIGGDVIQPPPDVTYTQDPADHWYYKKDLSNRGKDFIESNRQALEFIESHRKFAGA